MKLQLTIEDRHDGVDVTCVGVTTDGFPSDENSLAATVGAILISHLRQMNRTGALRITEGGGRPSWHE